MSQPQLIYRYLCARLGIDPRSERGMISTETAVVTFLLVVAAIGILLIINNYATGQANNIPEPQAN